MMDELTMKDSLEKVETGTLIFWDPVIQRALTEQSALQWICSAKPVFGRIYDLCIIAKVAEGWYLSDRPQTPGAFAYPVNIRFALDPELSFDREVEALTPLQRGRGKENPYVSFRKKVHFVQRLEVPMDKSRLTGSIVYEVFKNEVKQPTAYTRFSIPLKA
jgi:hypothetical protein